MRELTYLPSLSTIPTMLRKIRIEYPGAIYHVMNRGDHQEAIFRDDVDHTSFLETRESFR
ncbi:MAG: hypothetical protein ACI9OD_004194 [Limisphaerales bacterium]|jgi:hypothetical protein